MNTTLTTGQTIYAWAVIIIVIAVKAISRYKIFQKCGLDTWKAFVPGLSLWTLFEAAGAPGAFALVGIGATGCYVMAYVLGTIHLYGRMCVYFAVFLCVSYIGLYVGRTWNLAKRFKKSIPFFAGMLVLNTIFTAILAFSSDRLD